MSLGNSVEKSFSHLLSSLRWSTGHLFSKVGPAVSGTTAVFLTVTPRNAAQTGSPESVEHLVPLKRWSVMLLSSQVRIRTESSGFVCWGTFLPKWSFKASWENVWAEEVHSAAVFLFLAVIDSTVSCRIFMSTLCLIHVSDFQGSARSCKSVEIRRKQSR